MEHLGDLDEPVAASSSMSFPVLQQHDLAQVAQTIQRLFDPSTAGNPGLAKDLQHELQRVQGTTDAWGLIAGLAGHEDPNVRFFGAHTAQIKISRDWTSLPAELHAALLRLLLDNLAHAVSPSNPHSYQAANSPVVRKLFGCLASLLLRLPFHLFPNPLLQPLHTLAQAAQAASLPPSLPGSGFNTPTNASGSDTARAGWKMRLWALEWLTIVVEEIGRAGISEQKRVALRRHLDVDLPQVMETIKGSMSGHRDLNDVHTMGGREEAVKEMEGACRCAEAWIGYGLGADELTSLLPSLYALLPLPAASSAVSEALTESIFKYGKGTKVLTEPLIAWTLSPSGQGLIGGAEGEPSDEVVGFVKMLCALVEHSSEWLVARIHETDVQTFLSIVLRITGWDGIGGVDENVSELTLAVYPLLQEAVMDSPIFSSDHATAPEWAVAKGFFAELVNVTRRKVRWPGAGESGGGLGGMDKEDREAYDRWRRDAGEVIVCAYYILRDDMLKGLIDSLVGMLQDAQWQDLEAVLHCIRFSSEGVPLGEENSLPVLFSQHVLGALAQRPQQGKGEERLRLTAVCVIQAYEEWFKFHPDHLPYVLEYLVPSLTSTTTISRAAADALKALCDICRSKLVQHIGAFAQLHDKIGDLGAEEQTKVIQAITSVIQALPAVDAIGPVEGIVNPIVDRLSQAVTAVQADPSAQPILVQTISALTASFKGLSPSDDDIFDLSDEGPSSEEKEEAIRAARQDPRLSALRAKIEDAVKGVVSVWNGDGEVADAISSLVKHSTLSSETLISMSPLPLLGLVTTAAERSSSALWMSLASTLVLRINAPAQMFLSQPKAPKKESSEATAAEIEQWNVVGDSASRLVQVAGALLGAEGGKGMGEHPDVVEGWFKFCAAMATRFPGVLLRLPSQLVEGYMTLGLLGLATHERFSLKTTCEFFVALLVGTRFPSPLEPNADTLLKHYGPQLLRAIILSAGSEGPRSVIPNLAELLASFVQRIPGEEMMSWMDGVLAEEGFPDARATPAAKSRLKTVVLKSRTVKKMREALHEFALVSRGLDNTVYGNATALALDR